MNKIHIISGMIKLEEYDEEIKNKIYEIGTTTKIGQHGLSVYFVKKINDEMKGKIELTLQNGTFWGISISMKRS